MNFLMDNKPPLTSGALTELEQKIDYRLPEDYRSFLVSHNGGQPENQLLRVPDCHADVLIDHFLGIGRPYADIQWWLNELKDDLKDDFLPIGFDPGDNALLMDKSNGKIYYWDSARFFPTSTDEENAFWVADSFSELLIRLRSVVA